MKVYNTCQIATDLSIQNKYFSLAHIYNDEKPLDMHIHDCYEIYYSVAGGKQFLIDNKFYHIEPGDIFFINHYESHRLTKRDNEILERIVLSISPEYLTSISTPTTDLNKCFFDEHRTVHKVSLSSADQKHFLYFIHKLSNLDGFGNDLVEQSTFAELMVFLNRLFIVNQQSDGCNETVSYHQQMDDILGYINANIQNELSIQDLSDHFYLSQSYLCRIFKSATGTTINKYISARRISISKSLLAQGLSVTEACEKCGYSDYSNFLKAFTHSVGISPKKYAQFSTQTPSLA